MLTKTIKYVDFNGQEREEVFYFNLTKAEVAEMELETPGGLSEKIKRITNAQDGPEIIKVFKELILRSYGEKSDDGRHFIKVRGGEPLHLGFSQTEAYSVLFMELAQNAESAANFFNGIIPQEAPPKNLSLENK